MIVNVEDLAYQLDKQAWDAIHEGRNRAYAKGMRDAEKIARSIAVKEDTAKVEKGGVAHLNEWWYQCGACKTPIDYKDKYCRDCGMKLDWEEQLKQGDSK